MIVLVAREEYDKCEMSSIKKILLPIDYPNVSLGVIHQSAMLARHFKAQIVMLHVVTELSHRAGVPRPGSGPVEWPMLAEVQRAAQHAKDTSLAKELEGLAIQCLLDGGDPAASIVRQAQTEKVDLIMMPSHGFTFEQFLLGSVTAGVFGRAECPLWTGAHIEDLAEPTRPAEPFAIRSVLSAVDLGPRSDKSLLWGARMASEFNARLTVAHVTAGVNIWGPGGWHEDQEWKEALVRDASRRVARLEQDTGIKAEVFIGSGDVPKTLSQAVERTNADLLVTGSYPYGGNLRTHGYGIICAVPIPVLSV